MVNYKKITEFMRKKNIKSKELATRVGVSEAMMSYITSGLREPNVAVLSRLARCLDCTVDELICDE